MSSYGFSPKLPLKYDDTDGPYLELKTIKEVGSQNLKMIVLTNPASVGSLSFVALPSYMLTPGGATLNFVTTANAISIISYYVHATDKVLVNYVGNFA